ncbi:ABC transporter substrate-binding protein [Gracilinema caldarium]|uniref:Extracellular solute-binding protein family 1 n=1 Tax=Gracilinema caldarium (strain ATCC 51460 / DSM 7334 / H1) TaxID=744872 RepID=F8EWT1_GRAC1|nr:extracellular solute-binding protein [Gracilinema caldarium]AEJ18317.1 extracellular solute-binding protein family 1 [Gracilinema caldarium DSM 7334]
MKKYLAVIVACSIAATAFASGSNELVINSYMSDQAPKETFQKLVDDFQKKNPDIKVTVNTTAHEQFKTLLPSWLTSKQAPDVVTWFAGYRMQAFAEKGLLEPINDVFPGGSFEAEFPPAFKTASSYNGNIYFMPQSWYWWAVYYNKDVFTKLNLSIPKTADEFMAVCDKLKAAGIAPIAIGAKDTWTAGGWFDYMDSAVNGGEFHVKLTKGEVPYTDPAVKKTFGYIAEMAKRGYFMPNAASYSWQEAANILFRGEAGMYLMGQFIKDVAPADVKDKIDFFRFPSFGRSDYAVDTPTDGFMIPKNAKNKEAAKKFMAYLATAEAQEKFCKPLGRLAANKKVPVPNADAQRGLDMVLGAKTAMQFYDRDAPEEMAAKGMNAIVDIIANPSQLDSILTALDKERVRIYSK